MSELWLRPVSSTILELLKKCWADNDVKLNNVRRTLVGGKGLAPIPTTESLQLKMYNIAVQSSARESLIETNTWFEQRRMFGAAESCLRDAIRQAEIEVQVAEQIVQAADEAMGLFQISSDDLQEARTYLCKAKENRADVYNELGFVLTELSRYKEAKQSYEEAICDYNGLPYAYDNLGALHWRFGNYNVARAKWMEARRLYHNSESIAKCKEWAGHFFFEGDMLFDTFGELDEAEQAYRQGMRIDSENCSGYLGLLKILLERADISGARSGRDNWAIRETFESGIDHISRYLATVADLDAVMTVGEMHLLMRDYKAAEEVFRAAYQFNEWCAKETPGYVKSAAPAANLAVLITKRAKEQPSDVVDDALLREERTRYHEALDLFTEALAIDGDDLIVASNRAETLFRLGRYAEAEQGYLAILRRAPGHIDSIVGMAEVYLEYGKGGDCAMLEHAVSMLDNALDLAAQKRGSKRLTNMEKASLYALRGYVRVQQTIAERGTIVPWLAHKAYTDYQNALRLNPNLHLAGHAASRLKASFGASTGYRLFESMLPILVGSTGILLILFSILLVFDCFEIRVLAVDIVPANMSEENLAHRPLIISPLEFVSTITAAVAMIIVGVYLPRILKLKFAGVEIEKSTIDNIDTVNLMPISRRPK